MKRWILITLGLLLILGVSACATNEIPAATSAGFMNPEITAASTEIPLSASPTKTPKPTRTPTHPDPSPTIISSPTPIPESSLACWDGGGRIEEQQLETEWLDKLLNYLVYLPPCYDELPDRYYPTLYLIHGQTYSNEHWIDLGAIEVADRLIASGELPPFLMVFPYDRDHYIPATENLFGEAVFFDLIPAIDRKYRTIPEREFRAMGGISRGGNWAIHIGLPHPGFFGAIGAHSTPVFSTDSNQEIREWLVSIPFEELPRLFIDTGENDRWLTYTLVFEKLLNDEGIPHEWHLYPGFHEDKYWQAHLEEYLRWYADPWHGARGE